MLKCLLLSPHLFGIFTGEGPLQELTFGSLQSASVCTGQTPPAWLKLHNMTNSHVLFPYILVTNELCATDAVWIVLCIGAGHLQGTGNCSAQGRRSNKFQGVKPRDALGLKQQL